MKRLSQIVLLLAMMLVVQVSQAQSVREERKLSSYDAVKVSTGIDLYIRQGNKQQVTVEADEDDLEDLVTEVRGGELSIYFESNSSFWDWSNRSATVYVTVTDIKAITSSSGSDVMGETIIVAEDIQLESSSGANMKLQIKARRLTAESSSGSEMELSGEAEEFDGRSSSGSDLDARELTAKKATVRASSGSDLAISVVDEIDADASSGSDISYSGRPQYVNIDESSGGDVSRRNY